MRIVVDTNIFVSGIFWAGNPGKLLHLWRNDQLELVTTPDILDEYIRVLNQIGSKQPKLVREWIDFITEHIIIVERSVSVSLCRDPDDDKFLECAASGNADFIVTGDDDLISLHNYKNIPIITVVNFLKQWYSTPPK